MKIIKRITEHKYAVKTGDRKNGVVVHAWDEGHRVDWEGVKILESEPHYLRRRVLEDQQELKSGLWPCLKPDLTPITLNEHLTFPSFFNFSFPPINHFHLAITDPCLYQSNQSCIVHLLLIQLTKVHGLKRPALLLPIFMLC